MSAKENTDAKLKPGAYLLYAKDGTIQSIFMTDSMPLINLAACIDVRNGGRVLCRYVDSPVKKLQVDTSVFWAPMSDWDILEKTFPSGFRKGTPRWWGVKPEKTDLSSHSASDAYFSAPHDVSFESQQYFVIVTKDFRVSDVFFRSETPLQAGERLFDQNLVPLGRTSADGKKLELDLSIITLEPVSRLAELQKSYPNGNLLASKKWHGMPIGYMTRPSATATSFSQVALTPSVWGVPISATAGLELSMDF